MCAPPILSDRVARSRARVCAVARQVCVWSTRREGNYGTGNDGGEEMTSLGVYISQELSTEESSAHRTMKQVAIGGKNVKLVHLCAGKLRCFALDLL